MSHPSDAELERLTGEPHIDGWPLYSGLPPPKCRRPGCDGTMSLGKAIRQTFTWGDDFGGEAAQDKPPTGVTLSPGGSGKLVDCWKCGACGYSVEC